MSDYLTNALMWSLVGFICGYCFSRTRSFELVPFLRGVDMPVVEGQHKRNGHGRWWKQPVAIFMIIASLIAVTQGAYFSWERNRASECQSKVDARLLASQNEFVQEYKETWTFILNNTKGREYSQAEFKKHLKDLEAKPLPTAEELEKC